MLIVSMGVKLPKAAHLTRQPLPRKELAEGSIQSRESTNECVGIYEGCQQSELISSFISRLSLTYLFEPRIRIWKMRPSTRPKPTTMSCPSISLAQASCRRSSEQSSRASQREPPWSRYAALIDAFLACLPLPHCALVLRAIKFTNCRFFRHLLDDSVLDPLPQSTKRLDILVLLSRHKCASCHSRES
jgi:hypothetical protein